MTKLHYGGIAIRHEPDGELLCYFKSPIFEQEDIVNAVRKILRSSNNFSVRGVYPSGHSCYDNILKLVDKKK